MVSYHLRDNQAYVQTQSFENLKYVVNGIRFTNELNTLTWNDVLTLYEAKYNGSNAITLNIGYADYSTGNITYVNGLAASTDIDVILETATLPISVSDSKDGRLPVGSLTFVETR